MTATTWYNENAAHATAWLRALIAAGHLPAGGVDARSIADVRATDLGAVTAAHFFAGIGGWPLALRLAGWPAGRSVWTGSCPCQPFSSAGRRRGAGDARHCWPAWHALIRERRPPTILGEQVASRAGRRWLAGVRADLEALGYAVGAADLCAAGVGAPHIRQRLFWVAESGGDRLQDRLGARPAATAVGRDGVPGGLPDPDGSRQQGGAPASPHQGWVEPRGLRAHWGEHRHVFADGKARRIEPGLEPLAHGVPGRVGRLRAYGNAIVPQVAAAFVSAVLAIGAAGDPA